MGSRSRRLAELRFTGASTGGRACRSAPSLIARSLLVGTNQRSFPGDFAGPDDYWPSTRNKQLKSVQHVKTLLKIKGRAAVVVPDNVLFEGCAGETVRRKLLHECDSQTLLRVSTGVFYAQGVRASFGLFDRKPASEKNPSPAATAPIAVSENLRGRKPEPSCPGTP